MHFLKKLKQLVYRNTGLTLYNKPIIYTILACRMNLQHFTTELMFSSIPFSHLQYQNGTNLTGKYAIGGPFPKPVYNIHEFKLMTRLKLELNHLIQHKFDHYFKVWKLGLSAIYFCTVII